MKENFDVHNWNKRRYLGELEIDQKADNVDQDDESGSINVTRGGDDPKLGAELEAGVIGDKVAEGFNDKEIKAKLSDLEYNFLTSYFENERFNAPNPDDSLRTIYSPDQWESWKSSIMKRFGDVDVKLDNQGKFDSDKFSIIDKQFKDDRESFITNKAAALDKIRQRTNFGLDEAMDGGSLFDYFVKKGYKVTGRSSDGRKPGFEGYMVSKGDGPYPQSVIFQHNKDTDQFTISRMGGYRIDQKEAIRAGMRQQGYSGVAGRDSYITDGNYTPKGISVEGLKIAVDHVMGGLEREADAQADFYARRGPVSGTIDEAMDASRDKLNQLAMSIGFDEFAKTILMLKDENLLNDIVNAMKMYKVDNVSYYNPDVLENVAPNHDGKAAPYGSGYEAVKETLRFIKENNPEFTNEEIKAELKNIKELGSLLDEKAKSKLCKRGRDYIAARKRAGEKSSAYLSGRAVKVCKGQIKGAGGKRKKSYKGKK